MLFFRLVLLFTLVPFIELVLLLWISSKAGVMLTVGLVLVTGLAGAALARRQGLEVWRRIGEKMARGEPPGDSLADAVMIFVAGVLLITPGVLTDLLGFSLLVPPVRKQLKRRLIEWLKRYATAQYRSHAAHRAAGASPRDETVIDAEFVRQPAESDEVEQRP